MPRNAVVNRRNTDTPFVRKTMQASIEALDALATVAGALSVSQASLVDTALRHLATMDLPSIVELLRDHGHLTDSEYTFVCSVARPRRSRR